MGGKTSSKRFAQVDVVWVTAPLTYFILFFMDFKDNKNDKFIIIFIACICSSEFRSQSLDTSSTDVL